MSQTVSETKRVVAEFVGERNNIELTDRIIINGRTFFFQVDEASLSKILKKLQPIKITDCANISLETIILMTWWKYSSAAVEEIFNSLWIARKSRYSNKDEMGEIKILDNFAKNSWVYDTE